MRKSRALMRKCRALMRKCRALMQKCRSHVRKCGALMWKYRAVLQEYRSSFADLYTFGVPAALTLIEVHANDMWLIFYIRHMLFACHLHKCTCRANDMCLTFLFENIINRAEM